MKLDMRLKKEEVKRISCCTPCIMKNGEGNLFVAMPAANEVIYLQRNGIISWDRIGDTSYEFVRNLAPGEFVRNLEPGESFTVTI